MSESNPSERGPKDPVRIVYHAGDRTFARIFNEHSLEELKNVVRRKLGLGTRTDVSLKQMGHDTLLDLDDDDDFQAFRVLLKSCVSVDIRVTAGESQGSPAPVPQKSGKKPSAPKPRESTQPIPPSKEPAGAKALQPTTQPEVPRAAEAASTPAKKPEPVKRKRKTSFEESGVAASDKIAATTSIASAKTVEPPAALKPAGPEEPPKKKQRKEPTKAKKKTTDGQTDQTTMEGAATKASESNLKAKKATALDLESNGGKSVPKATETSEPLEKKQNKMKKDVSARPKKSSTSGAQDGTDSQSKSAEVTSLQLDPVEGGDTVKTRQSDWMRAPKGMICASIPQTNASTTIQSEITAAILSSLMPQASAPMPSTKRRSTKRDAKKLATSSITLPAEPTTVSDAFENELPDPPTAQRLGQVIPTPKPTKQMTGPAGPSCPICLVTPFHIRYCCPTVLRGPDAIRERLEEIRNTNEDDQRSLIKQLEGLLRDPKVISASTDGIASPSKSQNIPRNSYLPEVIVKRKGEDSSSESSNETSEEEVEIQDISDRKQKSPDKEPFSGHLEAIVRGPSSKMHNILRVLDRIAGEEDATGSDSEEDDAELEEDPEEETGRSRQLSYVRVTRSSDSESEEEESRSHSRSVQKDSAEPFQDDVVMKHYPEPPGPDVDNGSSEETHVGSEDHMVIDESAGEKEVKGAPIVAESEPSLLLQPSNIPCAKSQGSKTHPTQLPRVPAVPEVLEETMIDLIEPADDLAPTAAPPSIADPIEVSSESIGSLLATAPSSTPNPGVSKRSKNRVGQIPGDEADRPVLLEPVASNAVTPVASNGKLRKKAPEMPANQEPMTKRKISRASSVQPSASTPIVLLSHRSKSRTGKAAKIPVSQSQERSEASKSTMRNEVRVPPTPSLVAWETLEEPSSPSVHLDEPSMLLDELVSSSPHSDGNPRHGHANGKEKGGSSKATSLRQAESSQEKERLFDPSSSQIPFPYSQQAPLAVAAVPEQKEGSPGSENEPRVVKKRMKTPTPYRPLSQLASRASTFAPAFPTPTNKSVTNGKAKERAVEDEDSSSSSSDTDEANGSMHIPLNRRAGSVLEKKKKKSLLSSL